MKVRIALFLENLLSSFWLVPITIAGAIISGLFIFLNFPQEFSFINMKAEAAQMLLNAIATSIMTVLGVVFSITIVMIEQMAGQYTPRVIANFTRSKMAQCVLGQFVGTFVYCIFLLMHIDGENVPHVALIGAIIFALLCLLLLILYIHDITHSIQSTQVIKIIQEETLASLQAVIKDREVAHLNTPMKKEFFKNSYILHSTQTGYIDAIYWERLPHILKGPSWELHFHKAPGDYVQIDMELLTLWCDHEVSENILKKIEKKVYDIRPTRTVSQDPGYGIQKLKDIALKSLSSSINDSSTAIEAIHAITSIVLVYLKASPIKNRIHMEENKVIVLPSMDEEILIDKAYNQILNFSKEFHDVKEVIEQDLRFIQTHIPRYELKRFLEKKISTSSLFQ